MLTNVGYDRLRQFGLVQCHSVDSFTQRPGLEVVFEGSLEISYTPRTAFAVPFRNRGTRCGLSYDA